MSTSPAETLGRSQQRRRGVPLTAVQTTLVQLKREVGVTARRAAKVAEQYDKARANAVRRLLCRRGVTAVEVEAAGGQVVLAFTVAADSLWAEALEAGPVQVGPLSVELVNGKRVRVDFTGELRGFRAALRAATIPWTGASD